MNMKKGRPDSGASETVDLGGDGLMLAGTAARLFPDGWIFGKLDPRVQNLWAVSPFASRGLRIDGVCWSRL